MKLQVLRLQPGIAPIDVLAVHELAEQPAFGDPVHFAHQDLGPRDQRRKDFLPDAQDDVGLVVAAEELAARRFEKFEQQLNGVSASPIGQRHQPGEVRLMRQITERHHRIGQHNFGQMVQFQQVEHQGSRADL